MESSLVSATRVVEQRQPVFVQSLSDKQVIRIDVGNVRRDERSNVLFRAEADDVFDGQEAEITDT